MKMRYLIPILILIILSMVVLVFISNKDTSIPGLNKCQIEKSRENPVPLELATKVGINHVHLNNQPYNWAFIGAYPVYGVSGELASYMLVFRKNEFTTLNTLEKLEQNAELHSDATQDGSENKYQFTNIATIITGAMKEDKPIQRHFRGISEVIGKKIEIKKQVEEKYPGKTIGNLISDSQGGPIYYEIVDKDSKKGSGKLINIRDSSMKPASDLIKRQKEIEERKYSSLSEKECLAIQQAVLESERANIQEWDK